MTARCQTRVWSDGSYSGYACGKKAKYYENGSHYCGTHAPSRINARAIKKQQDKDREDNKVDALRWKIGSCKRQIKFSEEKLAETREKFAELYPGESEEIPTDDS